MKSIIHAAATALFMERDPAAIPGFFTTDYTARLTGRQVTGHAAIHGFLGMIHHAFPDLRVDVEILVEGTDRIAWQRTFHATHQGQFPGFPPTGKPLVWRDMLTSRFQGNLIAEEWIVTDLAERLILSRKTK